MIGGRIARVVVRFGANFGGVAFVLMLTAEHFDATELTALMFVFLWFAIVEAAIALAHVEPSEIDRNGSAHALLLAAVAVPALLVSGAVRTCGAVSVECASESMPRFEAAVARLRSHDG